MNIKIDPLSDSQKKELPRNGLGFGTNFTNRMFTQRYEPDKGWHDAVIGPYQSLTLDPSAAVFHYGQEIFDGTKAYRRPDGNINLFRPWDNMHRFNESAQRMAMPLVDEEEHLSAIVRLIELDHEWMPDPPASLYIRPVMIATDFALGVHPSKNYLHYVILCPVGSYFKEGFNPISVYICTNYRRAVLGGTGEAKTGGNYAASLLASREATARGFAQVLWLDAIQGRYVEEVGAMNICFVYEGQHIVTPALSGSILPGVTRESVLTLGRDLGYTVAEERIDVHQMLADVESGKITEVFGCGTAAVIAPIGRLGMDERDIYVNNCQVGPVATKLYKTLTDIQWGRAQDPYGWTYTIEVNGQA